MVSSKLILGTAQFGMDYGINNAVGKVPRSEVFEILNCAYENGMSSLDTAPVYGDAQKIIGEFHKEHKHIQFKVITKIPSGYPIESLNNLVDIFLSEMHVDCIEVLHFHSIETFLSADKQKVFEVFDGIKKSNKVKSFGVSLYENLEVEHLSREIFDVIQLPYNLLDNINLRGNIIASLKQNEFAVHSRSVFLQGLFFKNIQEINSLEVRTALTKLQDVCNLYNCDISHLALQYCLNNNNIDYTLIGVDSIKHLEKNLAFVSNALPNSIFDFVNNIIISDKSLINPSKWQKG